MPSLRFYMGKLHHAEQLTTFNIHYAYENNDIVITEPRILNPGSVLRLSKDINKGYCIHHPMGTLFLNNLLNDEGTVYSGIHILKEQN